MPHCEAPERDPAGRPRSWLDGFAICASTLCTVHCLGLPLLFALLPTASWVVMVGLLLLMQRELGRTAALAIAAPRK